MISDKRTRRTASLRIAQWRRDPALFVKQVMGVQPDSWQLKVLNAFPHHQRQALIACTGPGKTASLSWLIWNFLVTRPHPRVGVTSITATNLKDNLWAELRKWHERSPLLSAAFTWQADRIYATDHKDTWFATFRTWNREADVETQGTTLAGLHADYVLFVLDEAGGIPDAVAVSAEGALATGIETKLLIAGNPTHLAGPLYRAHLSRNKWFVTDITGDPDSPMRAPRVSLSWAQDMIEQYGADHPWVQVKVFGRFPKVSDRALIGLSDFEDAFGRESESYSITPVVFGIDVAREGPDETTVAIRCGDYLKDVIAWGKARITQSTGRVIDLVREWKPEEIRVDDIGVGGGLVDNLKGLLTKENVGYSPSVIGVNVGAGANDKRFTNLRAELNVTMRERWFSKQAIGIAAHLSRTTLMAEATTLQVEFAGIGEKIKVESKKEYRTRTSKSPDRWDAVVLAFANLSEHSPADAAIKALKQLRDSNLTRQSGGSNAGKAPLYRTGLR